MYMHAYILYTYVCICILLFELLMVAEALAMQQAPTVVNTQNGPVPGV